MNKRPGYLLTLCIMAMICFVQTTLAQSGRRDTKRTSPPPPLVTDGTLPDPVVRVSSVIVSGKVVIDASKYSSNDVSSTVSDCIDRLKERSSIRPVKGGTMTRQQAIERAKNETDAYVLWMEINLKVDLQTRGAVRVDHVEFFLFMPKTGTVVHQGRVDPNHITQINEHGARVPARANRPPDSANRQMEVAAREVADQAIIWF